MALRGNKLSALYTKSKILFYRYQKTSSIIIANVIILILFWVAKLLPLKSFTFNEELNYSGRKGIDFTIVRESGKNTKIRKENQINEID
jgi:hypothetical protein